MRYATRDATRREHMAKIQRYLQLRQLMPPDEQVMQERLLPLCTETSWMHSSRTELRKDLLN